MECNALDLITCHFITHSETDTNFIHSVMIFLRFCVRFVIPDAGKCRVLWLDSSPLGGLDDALKSAAALRKQRNDLEAKVLRSYGTVDIGKFFAKAKHLRGERERFTTTCSKRDPPTH